MGDKRGIIGQVQEERDSLHATVLLKVPGEEATGLQIDTHGSEYDGEVLLMPVVHVLGGLVDQTRLPADLSGDLVVGQTSGGEDGDLLSTSNGVHSVNGRNACRDHLFRVDLQLG